MRTLTHALAGATTTIHIPERREDLDGFDEFLRRPRQALAVDAETSGLQIYSAGYQLRLVQVGDADEAWVLRFDLFADAARRALLSAPVLVAHSSPFDLVVLDRFGVASLDETEHKTFDTRLLAHLIDPRTAEEGGIGHGLKNLSTFYVDGSAPDTQKGLHEVFKSLKLKISDGFAQVPLDNETYLRYAGLDVLLTARLFAVLGQLVVDKGMTRLAEFEHEVQRITTRMQHRGLLIDVDYANGLIDVLAEQREQGIAAAKKYGIENVESPKQVATALTAMGWTPVEFTPSGAPKVDKQVLKGLAKNGNPLATAVQQAKQAQKFRTAYVDTCLDLRDSNDRVHPFISSLQARTARMAISRPPLQQLPSGDSTIRRMFVTDPGNAILSVDYSQIEMRVLAVLSGDEAMLTAIRAGKKIHNAVAEMMFGPEYDDKQYKLAKNTGFGEVFGAGAETLARQAGVDIDTAKNAKNLFARGFPGIKRYGRKLVDQAKWGERAVVTPTGRRLPLDRDRLFASTNYVVQSTAADVLKQALIDIDAAGLSDHLLLPIHDELLAQAPITDATDLANEIARLMTVKDFLGSGVDLTTEAEVGLRSWGSLYGADL